MCFRDTIKQFGLKVEKSQCHNQGKDTLKSSENMIKYYHLYELAKIYIRNPEGEQ